MEMENRFNSSAYGPAFRLIFHSGVSLETAYRIRNARENTSDSRGCDDRSCRIRLNAAEREIYRARHGLDRIVRRSIRDIVEFSHEHVIKLEFNDDNRPPNELSSPPTKRKAYAPDPLGKPSPVTELPPEQLKTRPAIDYLHMLYVGSIIDLIV